jgi:hypothetical protein
MISAPAPCAMKIGCGRKLSGPRDGELTPSTKTWRPRAKSSADLVPVAEPSCVVVMGTLSDAAANEDKPRSVAATF